MLFFSGVPIPAAWSVFSAPWVWVNGARFRSSIRIFCKSRHHHLSDTESSAASQSLCEVLFAELHHGGICLVLIVVASGESLSTRFSSRSQHLRQEQGFKIGRRLTNTSRFVFQWHARWLDGSNRRGNNQSLN